MTADEIKSRWSAASVDISLEKFDGEYVALDMALGRYFALSAAASVVLDALLAGASPAMIVAANASRAAEITALINDLGSSGILIAEEGAPVEPDPVLLVHLASLNGSISLEAHDDLADLILADPIHDTDGDFGWPARK